MKKEQKKTVVEPRWATIAKSLMKSQGLVQEDLKEAFGVNTRGGIGHYLSGRREPSIEQIMRLSKRLGVTTSELVGEIPLAEPQDMQEISQLLRAVGQEGRGMLLTILRAAASQLEAETGKETE